MILSIIDFVQKASMHLKAIKLYKKACFIWIFFFIKYQRQNTVYTIPKIY